MKIDFSKLTIQDIEGKDVIIDISKELGNIIFQQTQDLGELDLAKDIYKNGEVDLTSDQAQVVKTYADKSFKAFILVVLDPMLSAIIDQK